MSERSEVNLIKADDREAFVARAQQALDEVIAIPADSLHCLTLCAVTEDGTVKVGILGSDADIAKMLVTITTIASNGVLQANSESNPTKETLQ